MELLNRRKRRKSPHITALDHHASWLVAGIVVLAAAVRIWSLDFGLPYLYHPDEPNYIKISQDIFKTSDLNPHFFNYPSLFFYLNALAYLPFSVVGRLLGNVHTLADIPSPTVLVLGIGHTDMPATILLGRLLTVAFSTGSVLLVYFIGRRVTNDRGVGLLAALFTALSPDNVANSRFVTPDTYVTFFVLLSFWGSVNVYQRGKTGHYVLAGIGAGLAASSKYNGTLIVLALVVAHFFGEGLRGALKERRLYMSLLLAAITFLATTPYAIFDFPTFLSNVLAEFQHYSSGHTGMDGNSLVWYVEYLWTNEGVIALLAVIEIARAFYQRLAPLILVSVFPLLYFVFINAFVVRNVRTLLPMTPFLFLLGASFLARLMDTRQYVQPAMRNTPIFTGAALAIVSVVFAAVQMVNSTNGTLNSIRSREESRQWIEQNLPQGGKVAIEAYSPYVDPGRFAVSGFTRMIDNGTQWYLDQGYMYLVFSQGMFGRYYNERVKYAGEVARYDDLFRTFEMVRTFPDEQNEIRIYRLRESTHSP